MAVPKKRTSKSKKNLRATTWKAKAETQAKKAFSKAKSTLKNILNKKQVTNEVTQ
jgi:ribosomal protein L32